MTSLISSSSFLLLHMIFKIVYVNIGGYFGNHTIVEKGGPMALIHWGICTVLFCAFCGICFDQWPLTTGVLVLFCIVHFVAYGFPQFLLFPFEIKSWMIFCITNLLAMFLTCGTLRQVFIFVLHQIEKYFIKYGKFCSPLVLNSNCSRLFDGSKLWIKKNK